MSDLTMEQVWELFDYDAENGVLIRKLRYGKPYNKPCGIKPNADGYGSVRIDGKEYLAHRVIWLLVYGLWPEGEIDHIDQDPMNNKIENLREASRLENMHNTGMYNNNSSGYPGVYFHKRANKYMAYIRANNKLIYLGYFATAEDASLAYQLAKIEHHPSSPAAKEYLRELTIAG